MRCRLCGYEFDAAALACHAGCPMGGSCSLICCPSCGYQIVDESKSRLARALRRLWPGAGDRTATAIARPRPVSHGVPLTHVPAGMPVEVCHIDHADTGLVTRLLAYGLAPGSLVTLIQRRPLAIVRVGETEVALSDEVLDRIWVVPGAATAQ